jgi:hypothetical protein
MNTKKKLLQFKALLKQAKKEQFVKVPFLLFFLALLNSNTKGPFIKEVYASEAEGREENDLTSQPYFPMDNESVSIEFDESSQEIGPATLSADVDVSVLDDKSELNQSSLEEKRFSVLQTYQMKEMDLNSFVNAVMIESSKCGMPLDEEQIISILDDLAKIPNEVKIEYILRTRGITLEQLYRTSEIVLAESADDGNNYVDAFGVTLTMANREISDDWVECGNNIYLQAHAKGQFIVLTNGRVNRFRGETNRIGFQAYLDCLYMGSRLPMHGYTSFRSWGKSSVGRVAYVYGGNRYFDEITVEERLRRTGLNDPIQLANFEETLELEPKNEAILSLVLK